MITVIYDGQCQLCQNSINWLGKKLKFEAIGYQVAPVEKFGLTLAQCEKQVYAVVGEKKYGGVAAVIFLLNARGNRILAFLLKLSSPLGRLSYRLIAANRQSIFVRALSKLIKKIS
jgi:predicted DCC family thiol-disulfide oxidoreductase YuxK